MSYPERGASYRNKPAWMDRAVAGEKRADGGRMEPLIDEKGSPNPGNYWDHLVEPSSPHAAQDAREQAAQRTRRTRSMPNSFPVGGEPKEEELKTYDHPLPYAKTSDAQDKMARGLGQSIGFKRGGRT